MRRLLLSAMLLMFLAAPPARAQLGPIGFDPIPLPRAAEAFAGAYGAKSIDEVAAVFRDSADPDCLRRAVTYLEKEQLDFLPMTPDCVMPNWLLEAFVLPASKAAAIPPSYH